jgi:hypothetical protein
MQQHAAWPAPAHCPAKNHFWQSLPTLTSFAQGLLVSGSGQALVRIIFFTLARQWQGQQQQEQLSGDCFVGITGHNDKVVLPSKC